MQIKQNLPGVKITAGARAPLEAFSDELARRYPQRVIQRFVMPRSVRQCREVFIMEITSRQELDAAIFTEAIATPAERASDKLMAEAERREVIRMAIVGLGEQSGDAIAYRHTNHDPSIPLAEISDWPSKVWVALHRFYGEVNGVPLAEIAEGIKGAQMVGAFYAPGSQDSAGTGRSSTSTGEST